MHRPFAAILAAVAISAGDGNWRDHPTYVMDVKWTPTATSPAFAHDGICYLFYAHATERDMDPGDEQIERCALSPQSKVHDVPPAGTQRIRIYVVEGVVEATRRMGTTRNPGLVVGFAEGGGGVGKECTVVVARGQLAMGHEIAHCYLGNWHSARSNFPTRFKWQNSIPL